MMFSMPLRLAILLAVAGPLCAADLRVIDAIKRRDHKAVTVLLSQHADINAAQPDGATALAWATKSSTSNFSSPAYSSALRIHCRRVSIPS